MVFIIGMRCGAHSLSGGARRGMEKCGGLRHDFKLGFLCRGLITPCKGNDELDPEKRWLQNPDRDLTSVIHLLGPHKALPA
jgi:hypothetical protein